MYRAQYRTAIYQVPQVLQVPEYCCIFPAGRQKNPVSDTLCLVAQSNRGILQQPAQGRETVLERATLTVLQPHPQSHPHSHKYSRHPAITSNPTLTLEKVLSNPILALLPTQSCATSNIDPYHIPVLLIQKFAHRPTQGPYIQVDSHVLHHYCSTQVCSR